MDETQQPGQAQVLDDGRLTENENLLWTRFAEASDLASFCQSWLAIQCRQIDGVSAAVALLKRDEHAAYAPIAVWPDVRQDMQHLTATAEKALRERSGVVLPNETSRHEIAYPIEVGQAIFGVVVLELEKRGEAELQEALRQLHWGIAWLADRFHRGKLEQAEVIQQRMMTVLDLAATSVEHENFKAAASSFVTELATSLQCDRVSIGFVSHDKTEVLAISHSAHFKAQSNLVRAIEAAMDEAIDQEGAIVYPAFDGDAGAKVLLAAERLHQLSDGHALISIPFGHNGEWIGAITLERKDVERNTTPASPEQKNAGRFSLTEVELAQASIALAGPMLRVARLEDRWIGRKIYASLVDTLSRFVGPGHVLWKTWGIVALLLVAFFAIANGTYRIRADAVTEGATQRAVVAPFNAFIEKAPARAGDVVQRGDLMAVLDDQDLQLERAKWASQRDQYIKELRQTKAGRDKARIGILTAQVEQANAQLALVNDQLARTELHAPQTGVIVAGDLSKKLGAPLDKGEVLFEIAPLDDYRIVMQIDDRDIDNIRVGQAGHLVLSALPEEKFPLSVNLITPVAQTEEGRNFFRVEATLNNQSSRLRPGMEGVAKISVGEKKLLWIWTHRFTEWLKLQLWSWWP